MKILTLTMMLISLACGRAPTKVEITFNSHLLTFLNEAYKRGLDIDTSGLQIYMVEAIQNTKDTTIAVCKMGKKEIQVIRSQWEKLDAGKQEDVILHELGHCVLDREHTNEKLENGRPKSIMYPTVFAIPQQERDYYFNELLSN